MRLISTGVYINCWVIFLGGLCAGLSLAILVQLLVN